VSLLEGHLSIAKLRSRQSEIIYHDFGCLGSALARSATNYFFSYFIKISAGWLVGWWRVTSGENLRRESAPKLHKAGESDSTSRTPNRFKSAFLVLCRSNICRMSTQNIFGFLFFSRKKSAEAWKTRKSRVARLRQSSRSIT
jgi:hypothetical protein